MFGYYVVLKVQKMSSRSVGMNLALISPLSHQIQMWRKWIALKLNQSQQQTL